jgi:hypothetical protein
VDGTALMVSFANGAYWLLADRRSISTLNLDPW